MTKEAAACVVRRRTRVPAGLGTADYVILCLPAAGAFSPSN